MIKKNILYVEDDDKNILSFHDAVSDWNTDNSASGREFCPLIAKDMEKAHDIIQACRIDCALLDLRIPETEDARSNANVGNELAEEVLHKCGMPMAIISGHTGDLDDKLTEDGLIEIFDKSKADSFAESVKWLGSHWDMMHVLTEARRKFEMLTSEVFVRRIWPQWKEFIALSGDDQARLATIVSRQFMSHAAEFLGLDENPDGESWHPFECYVIPPLIDNRPHTGDVFDLDDGRWIVLSPQCDMATGKVESVLMAKCAVGLENFKEHVEVIKNPPSESKKNKASRFLRKHVNQDLPQSLHFLPPLPGEAEPTIVQFPQLCTIPLATLSEALSRRKASVSLPFLGNVVQRFGSYLSRMGQPNIDVGHF
jgi:CheY-like chemotaxis protein